MSRCFSDVLSFSSAATAFASASATFFSSSTLAVARSAAASASFSAAVARSCADTNLLPASCFALLVASSSLRTLSCASVLGVQSASHSWHATRRISSHCRCACLCRTCRAASNPLSVWSAFCRRSAFNRSTLTFLCRKASACRIRAATSCRKFWTAGATSATAAAGFAEAFGERWTGCASGGDEDAAGSAAARSVACFIAHRCAAAAVIGSNSNGRADSLRGVPGEAQVAFAANPPPVVKRPRGVLLRT